MTRSNKGLVVLASGVVLFFLLIYGLFGSITIFVAPAVLLICIVGIGMMLSTLSLNALTLPHPWVLVLVGLAVALHWYIGSQAEASKFPFGLLVWALSPYLAALLLSCFRTTRVPAVAGATVALCIDALTFHSVFVRPTSSTASLALLFAPLWNLLVFVPGVTWLAWRVRGRGSSRAP
jgi:hypothetical protein